MFKMKALRKTKILILIALIITVLGAAISAILFTKTTTKEIKVANTSVRKGEEYQRLNFNDFWDEDVGVYFGAFFEDENGDLFNGESLEIGKERELVVIYGLENGEIRNGKIIIENNNFDFTTSLIKDSYIKNNYIGTNQGNIEFNNFSGPHDDFFTGIVSYKQDNDISHFSSSNKIKFVGDYYENNTFVKHIEKEMPIMIDWHGIVNANIEHTYDNQTYNMADAINGRTFDVSFLVSAEEDAKQLIISKNTVEGTLPKIGSFSAKDVKIDDKNAKITLNDDGTFKIEKEAKLNGTVVTKNVPRENLYKVTAKYPVEAINGKEDETLLLNIPVEVKFEGYNNSNEGYENPYKSNKAETTISIIYAANATQNEGTVSVVLGEEIYDSSIGQSRRVVSKEGVSNEYNKINDGIEDDRYTVNWQVGIGSEQVGKEVVVEEAEPDKFISDNSQETSLLNKTTYVGVYFVNTGNLLSSDGFIEIYNKDTNRLLKKLTVEDIRRYNSEENAFIFDIPAGNITIKTSEIQEEGFFEIHNIKNLNDKLIASSISENDFEGINKISSSVKAYISDSMVLSSFAQGIGVANYENAYSKVSMSLSDNEIALTQEKDITVNIKTETNEYIEKEWKDGSFIIKLPDEIDYAGVNNAYSSNPNVIIKSATSYKESGINYVKVITENANLESFELFVDLKLKCNPAVNATNETVELYYSNRICENYYKGHKAADIYDVNDNGNTLEMVGKEEAEISIISVNNMSGIVQASGYNNAGTTVIAPDTAIVDKSKSESNVSLTFTNKSDKDIVELKVIGKIPYTGNTDLQTGEDLGSEFNGRLKSTISAPNGFANAKVYYSEKENVNTDLANDENGWKENAGDITKIKAFMVDFGLDKIEPNQSVVISLGLQLNSDSGKRAYITNKAEYFINKDNGKVKEEYFLPNLPFEISDSQSIEISVTEKGTNNNIPNVSINVLDVENDKSELIKTNSEGKATQVIALNKTYKIKEAKIDDNHVIDENEISFKVINTNQTLQIAEYFGVDNLRPVIENGVVKLRFVNEIRYDLVLNKTSYAGESAEDVRFNLIDSANNSKEFITNQDGQIVFNGLVPNQEYTLRETGAKNYYIEGEVSFKLVFENGSYRFQVTNGTFAQTPSVTNNGHVVVNVDLVNEKIETYDLELINKIVDTNTTLPETSFMIYEGERALSFDSNNNGVLTKSGLHEYDGEKSDVIGHYVIKMEDQKEGYALDESDIILEVTKTQNGLVPNLIQGNHVKDIRVSGNKVTIEFENIPYYTITKIDDITEEPVRGAKYIILDSRGNTAIDANGNALYDLETNENGQIIVPLETGIYSVVETESPAGYKLNSEYLRIGVRQEEQVRYEGHLSQVVSTNRVGIPTALKEINGGVIVVENNGRVSKLNSDNTIAWTNQDKEYYYTDVEVTGNGIYAVGNNAEVVKYNLDGSVAWEELSNQNRYIMNVIKANGDELYALGDNGAIIKFDHNSNVEWSNNVKISNYYIDGFVVSDGIIAISNNGCIVKYGEDGTELWETNEITFTVNGADEVQNGIILVGENGKVAKIGFDGSLIWEKQTGEGSLVDVRADNSYIYVLTSNGKILRLNANGDSVSSKTYNGNTFKKLALSNNELYIIGSYTNNGNTVDSVLKTNQSLNEVWRNNREQQKYTTVVDTGDGILAAHSTGVTKYSYTGEIVLEALSNVHATDSMVYNGDTYIVGSYEGNGYVSKVSGNTVVYSNTADSPLLKLDIDNNIIYAIDTAGYLHRFDLNGNALDSVATELGASGAVSIDVINGKILVVLNTGKVFLYNLSTGDKEWEITDELRYAGATIINDKIYFIAIDGTIVIKDLNGNDIFESNDFNYQYTNIVKMSDGFVAATSTGILVKYDLNGNIAWTSGDFTRGYYDGVANGHKIYFVTNNGELVIFEETETQNKATISEEYVVREEREEYKIRTRVIGHGGTISGKHEDVYEYVKYGDSTTKQLIVTADPGYFISSIKINGEDIGFREISGTADLGELVDVKEDKTIEVEFKKDGDFLTIRKVDQADQNKALPNAMFYITQEETRPELTAQDKATIIGSMTPYNNNIEEEKITYNQDVSYIIGSPISNTTYFFSQGANGEFVSNNAFRSSTTARTYFEIDLTDETGNFALVLNANVSSEFNCDMGYAFVLETPLAPSYTQEEGRMIYFSGVGDSVTTPRDFVKLLQGGHKYYLHLGYSKDRSTDKGDDTFTVNSIKLYDNAVSTKEYNHYNFVLGQDGKYSSNNTNRPLTTANSYVPIDLRNYRGYYELSFEGQISSEKNGDIGYATITSHIEAPAYSQEEGRFVYESGTKEPATYSTVLEGGKLYYLNFGYYKNRLIDDGSDKFTVSGIDINLSDSNFINQTSFTNAKGEIYLKTDFGRFQITELQAPEGYMIDNEVTTYNYDTNSTNTIVITDTMLSKVIIHYLDKATNQKIAEDTMILGATGDAYRADPIMKIDDYELEKDIDGNYVVPSNASGIYTDNDIEVTYYYEKANNQIIVHHYIDGTEDKLVEDKKVACANGENYDTEPITYPELNNNYVLVAEKMPHNKSGVFNGEQIEVTYFYKMKTSGGVLVHYYEENSTNKIIEDVTLDGEIGDSYQTEIPADFPSNYELVNTVGNTTGTLGTTQVEVTYYFREKDASIINHNITITSSVGEIESIDDPTPYRVAYKGDITNYRGNAKVDITLNVEYIIDEAASSLSGGTYNSQNKTITWTENFAEIDTYKDQKDYSINVIKDIKIVYADMSATDREIETSVNGKITLVPENTYVTDTASLTQDVIIPGSVTVKYIDINTQQEIADKVIDNGVIGEPYDITYTKKNIDGYTMVEELPTYTGIYQIRNQVFTYKYAKNFDITVEYKNKYTNESITANDVLHKYEGQDYNVSPKNITGYRYEEVVGDTSGEVHDNLTITFLYAKQTKVTAKYYYEAGNRYVADDVVFNGYSGDPYTTTRKDIDGYTYLRVDGEESSVMTDDNIVVTYVYSKNTSVKVYFKDKYEQSDIATMIEIPGYVGKQYAAERQDIDGYTYVETIGNETGSMTEAVIEVTYNYCKNSNITIRNIDKYENTEIVSDDVIPGYEGLDYDATEVPLIGYTYVETNGTKVGKYGRTDIVITHYHAKNSKVTVRYKDVSTSGNLVDPVEITGYQGKDYQTEQKAIDGYTFVRVEGTPQGQMGRTNTEVTYYYSENTRVVTKYIDKYTNESISPDKNEDGYVGKPYTTTPKTIDGYTYQGVEGQESGEMIEGAITVKYFYAKNSQVIARYIDKNTNEEIETAVVTDSFEQKPYEVHGKEITGYTFLERNGEESGNTPRDGVEVKYLYAKNSQIITKYIDKYSNEEIESQEIADSYEGKPYATVKKDIADYTYIETDGAESGNTPRDGAVIRYLYAKNNKVTARYIDKYTNEEIETTVEVDSYEGKPYQTSKKDINGYTFIEKNGEESGNTPRNGVTVTYSYAINANVIVRYKDQDELTEIRDAAITSGYQGKAYHVERPNIQGFTYVRTEGEEEGTLGRTDVEITYYYSENTCVIARYLDKSTGASIAQQVTIDGYIGKEYQTTRKDINGYTFAEVNGEEQGHMTKGTTYVDYYYAKSAYLYVKHIDRYNGQELLIEKIPSYEGNPYELQRKEIDGYTFVQVDGPESGTTPRNGVEVKYYYAKNTTITTKFVDKYTNAQIAEDVVEPSYEQKPYQTTRKDIDGYTFVDRTGAESGKTPRNGTTITYYYAKNATVTTRFLDKYTGEDIVDPVVTISYEKKAYQTTRINIDGYTYIEKTGVESGATPREGTEIKYFYAKNSNVIVKYKDIEDDQAVIKQDQVLPGYQGKAYKVQKASINGYTYLRVEGTEEGTYGRDDIVITYYYSENSRVVTRFVDINTNQSISGDVTEDGYIGKEYQTTRKDINGYTYQSVDGEEHGYMIKGRITVTYYYAKNAQVITKFVDKNNGQEISQKVTENSFETKPYETHMKEIDGYTYLEVDKAESGATPRDGITVTYYYAKNATVTTRYLDKATNQPIADEVVDNSYQTRPYETNKLDIDGYTFIEVKNPTSGNTPREGIVVTYYYAKNTSVIVRYADTDGNDIIPPEEILGFVGKGYTTIEKQIEGYTYISNSKNTNGLMTETSIVVIYTYGKNTHLYVDYIDDITGESLAEQKHHQGLSGTEYDLTKDKIQIDGYTLIESPTLKGRFGAEDSTVSFKYKKSTSVTVRYINKYTGQEISKSVVYTGVEGQQYDVTNDVKDIQGFTLIEEPEIKSGGMPRDPLVLEYVYAKQVKVTVKYIDKIHPNEIIREDIVFEGLENEPYAAEYMEFPGYEFVEDTGNREGVRGPEDVTVIFYYAKKTEVHVTYVDRKDDTVLDTVIIEGYEGKQYETELKEFPDYIYIESTNNTTGSMISGEVIKVVYKYAHISEGVLERHIDIETNEMLSSELHQGVEGEEYKINKKDFEGFRCLEEDREGNNIYPDNSEGTMSIDATIVTYYYRRQAQIEVEFIDDFTGEKIQENEIIKGEENDEYDLEGTRQIEGYTLVKPPENIKGKMLVTKDDEENVDITTHVTLRYLMNTELVVRYVDVNTKLDIGERVVFTGLEGDPYKAEYRDFEGYLFDYTAGKDEDIMTEKSAEVIFYYARKMDVTVLYVDMNTGFDLLPSVTFSGKEGYAFDISDKKKEIDDYTLVTEPNESGVYGKDQYMVFYYAKNTKIVIKYLEIDSYKPLSEHDKYYIDGYVGKEYSLDKREFPGYRCVKSTDNAKAKMTEEYQEIVFYYTEITNNEYDSSITATGPIGPKEPTPIVIETDGNVQVVSVSNGSEVKVVTNPSTSSNTNTSSSNTKIASTNLNNNKPIINDESSSVKIKNVSSNSKDTVTEKVSIDTVTNVPDTEYNINVLLYIVGSLMVLMGMTIIRKAKKATK